MTVSPLAVANELRLLSSSTSLTSLTLRGCGLTTETLTPWLTGMTTPNTALRHLALDSNELTLVPESICGFALLEQLSFASCTHLVAIPRKLYMMARLRRLDLSNTPSLTQIPETMKRVTPQSQRTATDAEVTASDEDACRSIMRHLANSSERVYRVSLFVLGHGGSGKTTLLRAIEHGRPLKVLPSTPSTVGVDLASDDVSAALDNRRTNRLQFSVYDFAGQLQYMTTHQFFIRPSRCLALLLVDLSLPMPEMKRQLRHWIDLLLSLMPDATREPSYYRVLLVGAKCDLVDARQRQQAVAELMHDFIKGEPRLAWCSEVAVVSSKTGVGINELKTQCRVTADGVLESMGDAVGVPRVVVDVHELLAAGHPDLRPFMAIDAFFAVLRTKLHASVCPRSRAECLPILQALHSLGAILLAESSGLVCLRPSLLTQILACFIMSDEHMRSRFGRLESPAAVVPPSEAFRRLRSINQLAEADDGTLRQILTALAEWDVAFLLSRREASIYGQWGYLFPSLRPQAELMTLPAGAEPGGERWLGRQLSTQRGGIDRFFVRFQTHSRPLHDHRFKLYANGVLLRQTRTGDSRALIRRMSTTVLYVVVAGGEPLAFLNELQRLWSSVEASCGCSLEVHLMCPYCVQVGGGGEDSYPVMDAGRQCPGCRRVVSADELTGGALLSTVRQMSSRSFDPEGGEAFFSDGIWERNPPLGFGGHEYTTTMLTGARTDSAIRRAEYRAVSDRFYRFMGKESQQRYSITSVEVINNPALTARFAAYYQSLVEASMSSATGLSSIMRTTNTPKTGGPLAMVVRRLIDAMDPEERGSFLLHHREKSREFARLLADVRGATRFAGSDDELKAELLSLLDIYDDEWRQWMMHHFEQYPCRVSGNEGVNLIMAFQGGTEESYRYKASGGNLLPSELMKLSEEGKAPPPQDGGYFGQGIYFTQYPSYGSMYVGGNNSLMLSWLALGRVYPVVEWPCLNLANMMQPAKDDERTRYGRPVKEGYDSHYILVHKKADQGLPCLPDQSIDGDEICVFRKEAILPRYIVHFRKLDDAKGGDDGAGQESAETLAIVSTGGSLLVWLDPDSGVTNQEYQRHIRTQAHAAGRSVAVVQFSSSFQARSWLERHADVVQPAAKQSRLRFITNRYRKDDGDELAGAKWIEWLRSKDPKARPFVKTPVMLFCSPASYPRVAGLHAPKSGVHVTSDASVAVSFGAFVTQGAGSRR